MRIWLRANDDDSEEVEVRPLKDSLFEILETPLFAYPGTYCGDIARLRMGKDELYAIEEVIFRPFRHWEFLIPGTFGASTRLHEFGAWVTERGGRWECAMLGLLYIHLPDGQAIDEVTAELNARLERFLGSEEHQRLLESGPPRRDPGSNAGLGMLRIMAAKEGEGTER